MLMDACTICSMQYNKATNMSRNTTVYFALLTLDIFFMCINSQRGSTALEINFNISTK